MRAFSIAMIILGLSIVGIACGEPAPVDETAADSTAVEVTVPVVEEIIEVVVDSTVVVVVDSTVVVEGTEVVEEVVETPAPEVTQ